jgi:hypothetical protein
LLPSEHDGADHGVNTDVLPAVARIDRSTVAVRDASFRLNAVFGPESIPAEIFNEFEGLVQSAVDGHNVLLMACGPVASGKTTMMRGDVGADGSGVIPRAVDELFAISNRDDWRARLDVDVQVIRVENAYDICDLLSSTESSGSKKASTLMSTPAGGPGPSVRQRSTPGTSNGHGAVYVHGAAMRRVSSHIELRELVEEGYSRMPAGQQDSIVILLHLTRTNRANGSMSQGKLVFAELAGSGQDASRESVAAYSALEAVIRAIAKERNSKEQGAASLATTARAPLKEQGAPSVATTGRSLATAVPFKEHKLTQLLQDCMGGSAKTVLLLTLPPCPGGRFGAGAVAASDAKRIIELATCGRW